MLVLARDQAGYLSLPSTPVTFTTSAPSDSSCQVSYAVTQGWGTDGGDTVDIGFAGANDGAYPSPAARTLNGTVCATTYSS